MNPQKLSGFLRRFALGILVTLCISTLSLAQKKKQTVNTKLHGYGAASYQADATGVFMRSWLVAGPIKITTAPSKPDDNAQFDFFKTDGSPLIAVTADKPIQPYVYKGKEYPWSERTFAGYLVNLDSLYSQPDFVGAYALAEIKASENKRMMLGLGSDDGVRVWLNGKLIHDNWIPRGTEPDQDVISLDLKSGSNQLLIKVQDIEGGWSFCARLLDKKSVSEQLVSASGRGDLDLMELLIASGANVNHISSAGLSAIANAKINGRDEAVKLLSSKGSAQHHVPPGEILTHGLYKPWKDKESAGIAVLVAKEGKVLYKNGFGYANIEAKQKTTTETKFRIGSITKQFVASGILKLEEEGKLKLTDKLSLYFPEFPRANEVTIWHLLTHTSGIHSYTAKEDFVKRVVAPITGEELVNYFKNDPYDFNPGDAYQYNNSGYFLAGLIIEKISKKSLDQFLRERFFDPLEMTNTGIHASTRKLTNEAIGYTKENGKYLPAVNWDMSWAGGAGALYSTVEDLFKWNEAVFNGKVLSEKNMKAAFTAGLLNNGQPVSNGSYGFGWGISQYRGEEVIAHGGGLHGFISQLARYRNNKLTVVILTNLTPTEVPINTNIIADYFLWNTLEKQSSFSSSKETPTNLEQYVGRYDFQNGAVMTVTATDNSLHAQLTGQGKFPIFPAGADEFVWKVVPAKIKFMKDSTGAVTHGDFEQNGFQIKAMKLKEPTLVKVDPALYQKFAGKYDYGNGMSISVTSEDQRLFAQATNQHKLELLPTADYTYVVKEMNATVSFLKADDGTIRAMLIDMAGQKKEAPRVE